MGGSARIFRFEEDFNISIFKQKIERVTKLSILFQENSTKDLFSFSAKELVHNVEICLGSENEIELRSYTNNIHYLEGVTLHILFEMGGVPSYGYGSSKLPKWTTMPWIDLKWWRKQNKKWWEFWV